MNKKVIIINKNLNQIMNILYSIIFIKKLILKFVYNFFNKKNKVNINDLVFSKNLNFQI